MTVGRAKRRFPGQTPASGIAEHAAHEVVDAAMADMAETWLAWLQAGTIVEVPEEGVGGRKVLTDAVHWDLDVHHVVCTSCVACRLERVRYRYRSQYQSQYQSQSQSQSLGEDSA